MAGPVVGQHHDDGVVEQVHRLKEGHQPTDLRVGVLQHGGERLLEAVGECLVVVAQVLPGWDAHVARRERGPFGHDPELDLSLEPRSADILVAIVEGAAPLGPVLLG